MWNQGDIFDVVFYVIYLSIKETLLGIERGKVVVHYRRPFWLCNIFLHFLRSTVEFNFIPAC